MPHRLAGRAGGVFLFWMLVLPTPGSARGGQRAPADAGQPPLGRIVERVTSLTDSAQEYALFLPSTFDPDTTWPVVLIMDPRGRAMIPARLFRNAAERLGYVLLSSYNTASDYDGDDPNEPAMRAMLEDAQRRYSPDLHRFYLVGFSGTARAAWLFARRLRGAVAGVVGVGAGLPATMAPALIAANWDTTLVFYGTAGTTDFNYEEVRQLDALLGQAGLAHHIAFFDGPHGWPPEPIASAALDWMELLAMRRELRPADTSWVRDQYARRLDSARITEAAGRPYDAYRLYDAVARDFADLADVEDARGRADALGRHRDVRRAREREDRLSREATDYLQRFHALRERLRTAPVRGAAAVARDLDIARLRRRAGRTDDRDDALAAQRLLETVFVWMSFYEPRRYRAEGEMERAALVLEVARVVKTDPARACFDLGRVYAQLQLDAAAMEALECAVRGGWRDGAALESELDLAPLRENPEFRALVRQLSSESRHPEPAVSR